MDILKLEKDTDFPVQAKTLRFLQDCYSSAIKHLCKMYGDNLILYGCELVGSNRTAGAVVINGELLPFQQSANNAKIAIVETAENAIYKGGEIYPAYYTRVAKCDGSGAVSLSSLRRVQTKTVLETDWVSCTPTIDIRVTSTIQCRINENGRVQVRGKYIHVNDWVYMYDFKLPAAYIPKYDRAASALRIDGSQSSSPILIMSNGKVTLCDAIPDSVYNLNFEFEL